MFWMLNLEGQGETTPPESHNTGFHCAGLKDWIPQWATFQSNRELQDSPLGFYWSRRPEKDLHSCGEDQKKKSKKRKRKTVLKQEAELCSGHGVQLWRVSSLACDIAEGSSEHGNILDSPCRLSELRDVWFPLQSEVKAHANTKVTQMQFRLCSKLSTNTMPEWETHFYKSPTGKSSPWLACLA